MRLRQQRSQITFKSSGLIVLLVTVFDFLCYCLYYLLLHLHGFLLKPNVVVELTNGGEVASAIM